MFLLIPYFFKSVNFTAWRYHLNSLQLIMRQNSRKKNALIGETPSIRFAFIPNVEITATINFTISGN